MTLDDHRHPCSERAPVACRRNHGPARDFTRSLWYRGARGAVFRPRSARYTAAGVTERKAGPRDAPLPHYTLRGSDRVIVGWVQPTANGLRPVGCTHPTIGSPVAGRSITKPGGPAEVRERRNGTDPSDPCDPSDSSPGPRPPAALTSHLSTKKRAMLPSPFFSALSSPSRPMI
jgi:hypothetical protein